jgi:methylenetetrahydrofolate dehydrogenase (NADP+)/methenyltetrahydrofolate cyclohydrolase
LESGKIIDGKKIASLIKEEVKLAADELKEKKGIIPGLAFILAGDDPSSRVYVKSKGKACDEAGFYSVTRKLPENTSEEILLGLIDEFNDDDKINGILVQLPLPSHIDEQKVISRINYKKDVDGFHPENTGRLMSGMKGFIPCTPLGIIELLKRSSIATSGKNTVVIGRSNIVGKPVGLLMLRKEINSTVTICHSATKDIGSYTRNADIIIAAMGKPDFIKSDMIKEGCVLIDVGINRIEDKSSKSGYKITGDIDYESCLEKCAAITPVPGGVGPMTIAMLLKNTLDSAAGSIF